jgi:hypothetical protein
MTERRLEDKQFDLVMEELKRIGDDLGRIQRRLEVLESLGPATLELARLSRALESLAYAALGREGPSVRRGRRG